MGRQMDMLNSEELAQADNESDEDERDNQLPDDDGETERADSVVVDSSEDETGRADSEDAASPECVVGA